MKPVASNQLFADLSPPLPLAGITAQRHRDHAGAFVHFERGATLVADRAVAVTHERTLLGSCGTSVAARTIVQAMGVDDHDLDPDYFEAELRQRLPPPVGLIFEHYEHLDPRNGLNLVLPPAIASYLVATHPRIPGSAQKGLRPRDEVSIVATNLSAAELRSQIERLPQTRTLIFLEAAPDALSTLVEKAIAC